MKEAYVSYEVAKLLKEKGFDWGCRAYWHEDKKEVIESQSPCYLRNITNPCWFGNTAPTQQMACDWLTEEKGLYISVVPDFNEYGDYPDDLYWFARVYDLKNGDYIHSTKLCAGSQEAFETALEYCLKNIA